MIKLQTKDQERFDQLEKVCLEGRLVFYIVGSALGEIRERKWYLSKGFDKWDEYCESIGYSKRHADQMILDEKAVSTLPKSLRDMITTERAAKELAKIPEALRPAVIRAASGDGKKKKVTAEDIKKNAPPPPKNKPGPKSGPPPPRKPPLEEQNGPEVELKDKTGVSIPQEILQQWMEAETGCGFLITQLKSLIEVYTKNFDGKDPFFKEVDCVENARLLKQVLADTMRIKPYAVCPVCQGKLTKDCLLCAERGWISEFKWRSPAITEEQREMRKKK